MINVFAGENHPNFPATITIKYITIGDNIKLARYLSIVHFKFMLKKLYDRCVELARHKFSKPLLGFVSFIESFFFPSRQTYDCTDGSS